MIPALLLPVVPYLRTAGRVLATGITIPLWLIIAAGLWAHFDKQSAVRKAAVELVAGAELEAARATAEANEKLRAAAEARAAEARRRAQAAEEANAAFAAREAEARRLSENLQDEIDELLANPVGDDCVVGGDLLERLRNVDR